MAGRLGGRPSAISTATKVRAPTPVPSPGTASPRSPLSPLSPRSPFSSGGQTTTSSGASGSGVNGGRSADDVADAITFAEVRGGDPLQAYWQEHCDASEQVDMRVSSKDKVSVRSSLGKVNALFSIPSVRSASVVSVASEADEVWHALSWFRQKSIRLVNNQRFDQVIFVLILWDLVAAALEVDYEGKLEVMFDFSAISMTMLFGVELLLRCIANGCQYDPLLLFDAFIELVSILDVILRFGRIGRGVRDKIPSEMVVISVLRVFRCIRIIKNFKLITQNTPEVLLLVQGARKSIKQLFHVLIFAGLVVFTFAVLLTMLVPSAATEGDAQNSIAVMHFGTIGRASYTLVSAMAGGKEWGIHVAFPLLKDEHSIGSAFLLITLLVAALVLTLVISGLVTGIFLDRILKLAAQMEAEEKHKEMGEVQTALHALANAFAELGIVGDEVITWNDVVHIITDYPDEWAQVKVEERDAKSMFDQLDELDRATNLDEFLVGLFTLRTVSRSIDMLSIDYEQERALQKISEFRNNVRFSAATLQSKLFNLITLLQNLEGEAEVIHKGIDQVQDMEKELSELRAENAANLAGAPKATQRRRGPPQFTTAERMADEELNRRLCELEKEIVQLSSANSSGGDSGIDKDAAAMAEVAVEVVQSFQQVLQQELEQVIGPSLPPRAAEGALALPQQRQPGRAAGGAASYLWSALHDLQ